MGLGLSKGKMVGKGLSSKVKLVGTEGKLEGVVLTQEQYDEALKTGVDLADVEGLGRGLGQREGGTEKADKEKD